MSVWDFLKENLSKTNLANSASFILIMGLMFYGIYNQDRDIIMMAGGWGGGYLFGASNSNSN